MSYTLVELSAHAATHKLPAVAVPGGAGETIVWRLAHLHLQLSRLEYGMR